MKYKQTKLKSTWARIRYFFSVLKCSIFKTNDVVICVLVVNNRCDFDCLYCFGSYHHRETEDYTTEEIKHLIDELYVLGTRYINIHGGEALLRRDIGEIIHYAKQKGMYCGLITNGSLLHKKIDQVRIVDNLTISLDGCKEKNDLNRGEGSYDKAFSAIQLAIKENIPLRVQATITKNTMNDVGYLANLAKDLGFSLYFSILFKPLPNSKKVLELSNEETREVLKEILEYKNKGYPIFTSQHTLENAINWPMDHNKEHFVKRKDFDTKIPKHFRDKHHIECYFGKNKITIDADGKVFPCFATDFDSLNWKEVGIKKAIRHVQENDDCVACPILTHNDHNLLFNLNIKFITNVIFNQIKEVIRQK